MLPDYEAYRIREGIDIKDEMMEARTIIGQPEQEADPETPHQTSEVEQRSYCWYIFKADSKEGEDPGFSLLPPPHLATILLMLNIFLETEEKGYKYM